MTRYVWLCFTCLSILAFDNACSCANPQPVRMSEAEARRTIARRRRELADTARTMEARERAFRGEYQ